MDFATCENCERIFHESFWLQSGDSLYCPACHMPAMNIYASTGLLARTVKRPVASIAHIDDSGRQLA
jgi:Zn finger protein HypA/HybF involved in hydrogenase expression